MSAGGPWSVKGIDPRARARAKTAARREGVTLGEWLNRVLLDDSDPASSQWEDALGSFPAFGGAQAVNDEEDRLLRAMVNRLSERVDSSEQLSSKALTGLDAAVTQLADKIGKADSRHTTSLGEARKNIETMLEGHKSLNDRIHSLETTESTDPDTSKAVETSVMRLARRLYESENDIAARLHETEQQTRDLSDTTRKTSDSLETRVERMEARASDFGDLSKRRDQRTAEALTGLHQATEKLRNRIDGTERTNNEASRGLDATAARLEERLRNIETRNSGDNVELERRFDRLSDDVVNIIADTRAKLDRAVADNKMDPRVDRLESALNQALQRIDEADRRQGDSMSRLGDEITRLAGAIDKRMSESEQRTLIAARDARSEQNLDRKLDVVREENKSAMRRMGEEVTRLGHSLADRIVKSEEKSASSVETVSDRMASAIERMEDMRVAREDDLDDRLRSTEERTAKRIEDAMGGVQENLASMRAENAETMTPVQRAMSALADRLEAIEKGDEDDEAEGEKAKTVDSNAKTGPAIDFDTPLAPPPQAETPVSTFESEDRDPFLAMNAQPTIAQPVAAPILREPSPDTKTATASPQPTPKARPQAKIGATADPDFLAAARARTQTDGRAYGYTQSTPSTGGGRMFIGGALAVALIAVSVLLFIVLVGEDDVVSDTTDIATSENLIAHMEAEFAASDGVTTTVAEPSESTGENLPPDETQATTSASETVDLAPQPVTQEAVPANVVADASNTITPEPVVAAPATPTRTISSNRVTLEQAATNGDPVARYMLGMRRQEAGDLAGASILLRRAAEQGVPAAQYRFAKMLETGEGVEIDLEAARRWTERAANSGHRRAMHNLAIMNFYGAGVPQNFETAARWFQEASLLGLRDSQFNLALLYEQGQGVPLSLPDAYAWYMIAATDNDPTASQRAADLVAQMTADARVEARQVAANFQPAPLDAEANGLYQNRPWDRTATSNRQSVQRTQGFLSVLGYAPGPIDGTMGEQTRQAIMSFEADHGLPRTGRVDAVLIERLEQAVSG
jgi:localization factor PodJL